MKFKLKHKKLEKKSLDDVLKRTVLVKGVSDNTSISPRYDSKCHYECSYPAVDISLYELDNVYCNIESSSFVTQDIKQVYIEEFPYISCKDANYKSGILVRHDTQHAYIKNINKNKARQFHRAFFLGGNGSFNFYHWMIEIAPKLLLLNDDIFQSRQIDTIIIHECVQKNANYQWLLQQCLKHLTQVNIVYAAASEVFFVEKLFVLNTFNQTVYNYNTCLDAYRTLTIFNCDNIDTLRHRLLEAANVNQVNSQIAEHKKIFILRNEKSVSRYNRRGYNQDEVFAFFEKEGFVGVYPDKLSLNEQISLFQAADFIVGPTGAAWSNLLFANQGTKAISWLPYQLEYFDTYCSLASLVNVDMRFLQYETKDDSAHGPYQLDIEQVIRLYQQMK